MPQISGARNPSKAQRAARGDDRTALDSGAIDLGALESAIRQLPEIDTARVVELHNRIMAGEYPIDTLRLAGRLIDLEDSLDR